MATVIQIDNISKRYHQNMYRASLRHEAGNLLKQMLGRRRNKLSDEFWALRNISLSVAKGEAVAIVGRNGAGKTTLLRLLSGITEPTSGSIVVDGRFVSLIGLSAGFDYERSGIENIYLNSAIYGMSPSAIREQLDDIIEFSELGPFLNIPIKRYSSGMIARLGFSIAIHILPDIVFLDEVLSVGDAAFQGKCIERIMRLKEDHCTILFVSHDAGSIRMLCERTVWLHHGEMLADGKTEDVLAQYQGFLSEDEGRPVRQPLAPQGPGDGLRLP